MEAPLVGATCDAPDEIYAGDRLSPILGCFTEGFATPDLIEPKALLDELCK